MCFEDGELERVVRRTSFSAVAIEGGKHSTEILGSQLAEMGISTGMASGRGRQGVVKGVLMLEL